MIITLKTDASKSQVDAIIHKIKDLGFQPHMNQGKEFKVIGVIGENAIVTRDIFEAMEGVWLASASFLEVCLEKEAQKTLEFFKGQVLEVDTWIKKNQAMIVKNPYDFYQANIQNKAVPFIVKREWLRSGRMYVLQNHLNSLIDEKEKAIFRERLLAEDPKTLQEVADLFGLTRERARQIEVRVIQKLRGFLGVDDPKEI